jgi:hypothetical protein
VGAPVGEPPTGSRLTASVPPTASSWPQVLRDVALGLAGLLDHAERDRRTGLRHHPQLVRIVRLRRHGCGADQQLSWSSSTDTT